MLRKMVCALVMFGVIVAFAKAAEVRVLISKVDAEKGTITYKLLKKGNKTEGDDVTVKIDDKTTFVKGKRDPDDKKKLVDGDTITEGLKADVFSKIDDKGVKAVITTADDDKPVTKVMLMPAGKKKKAE